MLEVHVSDHKLRLQQKLVGKIRSESLNVERIDDHGAAAAMSSSRRSLSSFVFFVTSIDRELFMRRDRTE